MPGLADRPSRRLSPIPDKHRLENEQIERFQERIQIIIFLLEKLISLSQSSAENGRSTKTSLYLFLNSAWGLPILGT